MDKNETTPLTLRQRVEVQTEVLVPLLQHFRTRFGKQAANELVYPVLRETMRNWIAEIAVTDGNLIENWHGTSAKIAEMFTGNLDLEMVEQNDRTLSVDVTRCRYADFFRNLCEPELGAILTCELDNHIADRSAPDVQMMRETTIMAGGTCCPFR
ncbi:L-2-amino-thiazoline-4-carboxylic acid hydrolase [Ruegeria sp. WL0004]|uniref:L-2-amino-thiazoline-4-carboxylic acid hydrolase n=1 Tax=Ruegeria marisflavi TaxID=2984152 RepID=A0ABT2WPV3_9RHOB|nr:L-2-amino-thiazoline-4-carboxylic acid hydrolase [Ruegeria sp. WL0004]MCU9837945.1 L-2-amino-thiazoline-4-carboxylic acid hydrolase [Ruegeria sp. WL0004]